MAKKKLEEAECRNCGKPIYYSEWVGSWLHWESAARECTSSVAEPKE